MPSLDPQKIDEVMTAVCKGGAYRDIHPELVRRITALELAKGRSGKEAVKAVRSKLHQVGGAYEEKAIDYLSWLAELTHVGQNPAAPDAAEFCTRMMACHASTRERLPVLERLYAEVLSPLGPIHSILDLACGLNPLAIPWMPLAEGAEYYACDIFGEQMDFLNRFFAHLGINGKAELCDLSAEIPDHPAQVALLLKAIPCLEQLDKSIGPRLLEKIPAEHLVVSFPAHSLGGRDKGMPANYEAHFMELVAGKDWSVRRFLYPSELVFLVSRD